MKEINKKYELGFSTIQLNKFSIIDPSTLRYDSEENSNYYPLSDVATKQLANMLELPNKKFSYDLYEVDSELWRQLIRKRLVTNNVKNYFESKNALIINDEIVNFFDGTSNLFDVFSLMNNYIESPELTNYADFSSTDTITLISIDKNKVGTLIKYYFKDNWIVIYDCYYDYEESILILAPYYVVDSEVNKDTYSISNKDICYASSSLTMPQSLESYFNELNGIYLSAEEMINYMRKYFKLKLKVDPIDPFLFGAERDYSEQSVKLLSNILDKLYSDNEFISRINTNYIKKTIYITGVSFLDLIKLVTSRIKDGSLDINVLRDLEFNCFKHTSHYSYLK